MQAVYNDDLGWMHFFWISKGACLVIVDRLNYCFSMRKPIEMLGHERKVISDRMQGSDADTRTCSPIKRVIIVETDMHNAFLSEDPHHAIGQGSFPRSAIAADRHNQRLLISCNSIGK